MTLYDLATDVYKCVPKKGCIWCTDGSIIPPEEFSSSGREAYGYFIRNHTAVKLTSMVFDHNEYEKAESACKAETNAGVKGLLPSYTKVEYLMVSHSNDKELVSSLIKAGVYDRINYLPKTKSWRYVLYNLGVVKCNGWSGAFVFNVDKNNFINNFREKLDVIPFFYVK